MQRHSIDTNVFTHSVDAILPSFIGEVDKNCIGQSMPEILTKRKCQYAVPNFNLHQISAFFFVGVSSKATTLWTYFLVSQALSHRQEHFVDVFRSSNNSNYFRDIDEKNNYRPSRVISKTHPKGHSSFLRYFVKLQFFNRISAYLSTQSFCHVAIFNNGVVRLSFLEKYCASSF